MKREYRGHSAGWRFAAGVLGTVLAGTSAHAALKADYGPVEARLTGRFMVDTRLHSTEPAATEALDLRRARLGVKARIGRDWRFRASTDFATNHEFHLRDLRLDYRGFKPVHLMLGRMQEPFGLSATGSSNDLRLMERPIATALGADYNFGLAFNTRGERWGLTAGVFGPAVDSPALVRANEESSHELDRAITARFTGTPLRGPVLLHLGASASRRDPDDDRMRVGNPPESGSAAESILLREALSIDAPTAHNVDDATIYGLEFALRHGAKLLEAEYIRSDIDRRAGHSDLNFDGYYVEGSWVLTGERRAYSTRRGSFGSIRPRHRYGAWELALRYGELDLRDQGIRGDKGETVAAGVNWYPVKHVRLMLNGVHVRENQAAGGTDSESIAQMRAQVNF